MLINGERINVPFRREIVFPRVQGDIVFTATAVSIEEEFEKLCPPIEPAIERDAKDNIVRVKVDDPKYIAKIKERQDRKFDLQVISALENVEWETVDRKDPDSWKNWRKEAIGAGLSDIEVIDLVNRVFETLRPSAELVEEQKKSFLAQQGQETA